MIIAYYYAHMDSAPYDKEPDRPHVMKMRSCASLYS